MRVYVNLLLDLREEDVHMWDIPDQRCASLGAVISTLCTYLRPQGAQTAMLNRTVNTDDEQ